MRGMTVGIEVDVLPAGRKRWGRMTEQEIDDNYSRQCSKCRFRGVLGNKPCCDYLTITGKRRGCSPIGCIRFETGRRTQTVTGVVLLESGCIGVTRKRKETKIGRGMTPSRTFLGKMFEDYMKENCLNQRTLADRIGVGAGAVTDWRLGRKKVTAKSIKKIAAALGVDEEKVRDAVAKGLIGNEATGSGGTGNAENDTG